MTKAIFPGTFDPIHYGHIDIALRAAKLFETLYIAVYDRPLKNLIFSPEERIEMVKKSFDQDNIKVIGYNSLTIDLCKKVDASVIVRGLRVFSDFEYEFRMALANNRLAPDIDVVAFITSEKHTFLSSTTVREIASLDGDVSSMVPPHVISALDVKLKKMDEENRSEYTSSLRD